MAQVYIPVYLDWPETTEALSAAEKGRLIDALCLYVRGEAYESLLQGNERILFPMFREQINRANVESQHRAEAARENGKRGGRPRKTDAVLPETEKTQETQSVSKKPNPFTEKLKKEKEKEEYKDNKEYPPFIPPVVEELPSVDEPGAYASSNLQHMSPTAMEECDSYVEDLGEEIVRHAVDVACDAGKRTWGYAKAILNRYAEQGIRSLGDAKASDDRFKASRARAEPKQGSAQSYQQRPVSEVAFNDVLKEVV